MANHTIFLDDETEELWRKEFKQTGENFSLFVQQQLLKYRGGTILIPQLEKEIERTKIRINKLSIEINEKKQLIKDLNAKELKEKELKEKIKKFNLNKEQIDLLKDKKQQPNFMEIKEIAKSWGVMTEEVLSIWRLIHEN